MCLFVHAWHTASVHFLQHPVVICIKRAPVIVRTLLLRLHMPRRLHLFIRPDGEVFHHRPLKTRQVMLLSARDDVIRHMASLLRTNEAMIQQAMPFANGLAVPCARSHDGVP